MAETLIRRGDMYWVHLDPTVGPQIKKKRPAVIIQNNVGNRFSPLTIVAPVSSMRDGVPPFPILVLLNAGDGGIPEASYVNCGQLRTIDTTKRLGKKIGTLSPSKILEVDRALRISLDL